jgi:hypothetical protein
MDVNENVLRKFLNQNVKLVKDDNFVIYGLIKEVYNDCVTFYTAGKTVILSFNSIKEVDEVTDDGKSYR